MSVHKNNKFTQIDNLIPECNILSCVIKDKELNNNSYLPKLLDCRIYFATDENNPVLSIPTQFSEYKFNSTKFMNNKNRNYMIAELPPEIKTDITKLLGRVVCLSQSNPLDRKLYLEAFRLPNDNYYERMSIECNPDDNVCNMSDYSDEDSEQTQQDEYPDIISNDELYGDTFNCVIFQMENIQIENNKGNQMDLEFETFLISK